IAARAAYLDLLDIKPGERVLDVGCGSGVVTRDLARRGTRVTAVDPQLALLAVAQELAQQHGLGQAIDFRLGEASRLPVPDSSFDVAVCITVLEHMPAAEDALPELVRVLAPGGRLGVYCGDHDAFIIDHPDRTLTRRIIGAFTEARLASPWIARRLPALLR